jgi:sortase A
MLTKHKNILSTLLLLAGSFMLSKSLYMNAKAELAQHLISSAWQSRQVGQPAFEAWPWSDTFAIAKFEVPRLGIEQYVMKDASGESLAFGPGHLPKSELPANFGHSMIAGHRDSHFDFIKNLELGDKIIVTNYLDKQITYLVKEAFEMDTRNESLILYPNNELLTLITCYPFNEITTGGPLRWIVEAEPVKSRI